MDTARTGPPNKAESQITKNPRFKFRIKVHWRRGEIILFLSSLPLPLSQYLYRGCGLAYPHDRKEFVGAQKKTSVDLLVLIPR